MHTHNINIQHYELYQSIHPTHLQAISNRQITQQLYIKTIKRKKKKKTAIEEEKKKKKQLKPAKGSAGLSVDYTTLPDAYTTLPDALCLLTAQVIS